MAATTKSRGLGRGLGELFQRTDLNEPSTIRSEPGQDRPVDDPRAAPSTSSGPTEEDSRRAPGTARAEGSIPEGSYFAELPMEVITPNPRQPRTVFDEDAMAELVESIAEVGLLQPVVVRPLGDDRFELVMGERRWRAAQAADLTVIPAIVRETKDHDLLRDALLENLHRAQLNPLEEAAAYQQLLTDFGCTQDELASRIKRSRPQISNTLRLLRLPATVQRRVAAGVLSAGHARALLGVPDAAAQERLAQRVVAEGLSVRSIEELVALGETGDDTPTSRRPGPKVVAPEAAEVAARLSDHLDTRVRVDLGRRRGRITIDFASADDLERIAELIEKR